MSGSRAVAFQSMLSAVSPGTYRRTSAGSVPRVRRSLL